MINVFEPYIFSRDKFEVLKSLNKKEISGTSRAVQDLEDQLSIFFNRKYSLAVSNGSSALDVALNALKLKEGDDKHLIIYKEKNGDIPNYDQFLKLWGNRNIEK